MLFLAADNSLKTQIHRSHDYVDFKHHIAAINEWRRYLYHRDKNKRYYSAILLIDDAIIRISYEIFIWCTEAYVLNEAALLLEEQVCRRILDFDRKTPTAVTIRRQKHRWMATGRMPFPFKMYNSRESLAMGNGGDNAIYDTQ